jgi:autoinducer 2-degrading protein
MTYVVIAQWTAQPGQEAAVREALLELTEQSRAEPGSLTYQPHEDPTDPRTFVIYEEYVDQAAFQAHADSDHFRRIALERAIPLLESRERLFLAPLDAGG